MPCFHYGLSLLLVLYRVKIYRREPYHDKFAAAGDPSLESERPILQPDIYPGGITQKYDQVVLAAVQGCARAANLPM